jgi:catechol 2,3-dioxygenase-like lactoylglutathione lyase family enzyme
VITGLGSAAVLVKNARESAEWYKDKLEFDIVEDRGHIVFVKPKGSEAMIHLCEKCDDWGDDSPGGKTGIWFRSGSLLLGRDPKENLLIPSSSPDLVETTYVELKSRGVEFTQDLMSTSWGKMAIFKDPDGNEFEIS